MPGDGTTPGSPAKVKLKKDTGGAAAGKAKSSSGARGPSKWPITNRHLIVKVDPDVFVFYDRQKGPQHFLIDRGDNKGWEVKDVRRKSSKPAEEPDDEGSDDDDDDDDDYDKELIDDTDN